MKTKLFDKKGNEKGSIDLPKNFSQRIREDILSKVFESQRGLYMQSYGAMDGAGAGYSASGISIKARHKWKGTYGKGIARVPRKIMSRHGASFNWVGATVSSARGGRKPHAPRSEKTLVNKINKKELLIAFNSAIAGTVDAKFLEKKYGKGTKSGFVFTDEILEIKTKDFVLTMKNIFGDSFSNVLRNKKVRAGIGKMRGRKYKSNAGLLFVVGNEESMKRKGITVVNVINLTIKDLSPNGEPGRLVCYTENAIKDIQERFSDRSIKKASSEGAK